LSWLWAPGGGIIEFNALLPVCAAFGYALTSVLVKLFDKDSPSATINLYTTFGALICTFLLMIGFDAYQPISNLADWFWMLCMGLVGGFAVLFMIMAYRLTQPSNLSPFEYFGIPITFSIGWLVFGEAPFGKLFPGVILVVAGGLLIIWRERQKIPKPSPA